MAVELDVGVDRAARLAPVHREIMQAHRQRRTAGEQRVAEDVAVGAQADPGDAMIAGGLAEKRPLIDEAAGAVAGVDLLQRDDVGVERG